MMVGRLLTFWEGLFSGAMLVSGRVFGQKSKGHFSNSDPRQDFGSLPEDKRRRHVGGVLVGGSVLLFSNFELRNITEDVLFSTDSFCRSFVHLPTYLQL